MRSHYPGTTSLNTHAAHQPQPYAIAVVDDDRLFRESLSANLMDAGYTVHQFSDGDSFLEHLNENEFSVVLLDWKMPGRTGIEVLQSMRGSGNDVPVILLTVLTDQIYEEAALKTGAFDYVEKSRSFAILRKRIELITTRREHEEETAEDPGEEPVRIGDLDARPAEGTAVWKGHELNLTHTELLMVCHLARQPGRNVRYRELYDLVHGRGFLAGGGDDGFRSNVRTFIKRIRQKFREVDPDFSHIENYAGYGYRWRKDDSPQR